MKDKLKYPKGESLFPSRSEMEGDVEHLAIDINLDLIDDVLAIMKDADISQRDLAESLGVSESAVSQLMSGGQNTSMKRWLQVCKAISGEFIPPKIRPQTENRIVARVSASVSAANASVRVSAHVSSASYDTGSLGVDDDGSMVSIHRIPDLVERAKIHARRGVNIEIVESDLAIADVA